ncbi:MAG: hypothetical protein R3F60_09335 [bacterium]
MGWAKVLGGVIALGGCGGGASMAPPELPRPTLRAGAWQAACAAGDVAWLARPGAVERWRFGADGPVQEASVALEGAAQAVGCAADRALLVRADGRAVGVAGEGVAWEGAAAEATGWPAPTAGPQRLASGADIQLAGGALAVIQPDGQIWQRPAAAGLRAALWDGERVWAAGASGVWWWRPGAGSPVPMGQPTEVGPAERMFQDGSLLWLVDASGRGLPFWPRGPWLVPAGEPGQVLPADRRVAIRLGRRRWRPTWDPPG